MLIGMASLLLLSCKEKQPAAPVAVAAPVAAAAPTASAPDMEHLLNEALSLMEKKQFAEAEKLMVNGLRQTASVHGQKHPAYAAALFKMASLYAGMKEWMKGADACHQAAAIEGTDPQTRKDRLTYSMNEAEFLQFAGQPQEALKVMRENVVLRREFYGETHSGHAYGLTELASALLLNGESDEALKAANEAVAIDLANSNPHVSYDMVHQGVAAMTAGHPGTAYERWHDLSPELRNGVLREFQIHSQKFPDNLLVAPAERLSELIKQEPTSDPGDYRQSLIIVANVARAAKKQDVRAAAFRALVGITPKGGLERIDALRGLGFALGDLGDHAKAVQTYEQAYAEAAQAGLSQAAAECLREQAIALNDAHRFSEAAPTYTLAVSTARELGDAELLGKALGAQGIFLHHQGRIREAAVALEEAAKVLPLESNYTFYVLNHLVPAREGTGCRCKEQGTDTLTKMLKGLLVKRIGDGFVDEVVATGFPDNPYQLKLKEGISEADQARIADAWQNSLLELRLNILNGQ